MARLKRILVAAVPMSQARVEQLLADCALDFASSMESGERHLRENRYSEVLIGHLFAESRMFEFARLVRRLQPSAKVICVKGSGQPMDETKRATINLAVQQLGCEGFIDLTAQEPATMLSVFDDLLRKCREHPQPL